MKPESGWAAVRSIHTCEDCGNKYLEAWPACPECSTPNANHEQSARRSSATDGDAEDKCVVCSKAIGDDAFMALDADRGDDGPKMHEACSVTFECDPTPRCGWCFLTMEKHQLARSKADAGVAPAVQGGAVGSAAPAGPMINLHEGSCVELFTELHGTKCVTCGRVVHLGLELPGGQQCHKGFCYEQALLIEREALAKAFMCVACGVEIADDYYEFGEGGESGEGGGGGGGAAAGGAGRSSLAAEVQQKLALVGKGATSSAEGGSGCCLRMHTECWKLSNVCAHCGGGIEGSFHRVDIATRGQPRASSRASSRVSSRMRMSTAGGSGGAASP